MRDELFLTRKQQNEIVWMLYLFNIIAALAESFSIFMAGLRFSCNRKAKAVTGLAARAFFNLERIVEAKKQ